MGIDQQHHFGLGIVPGRVRSHADLGAPADCRQHRRLSEDLRVRADRDLEILRPHAIVDQRSLERGGVGAAGHHRPDASANPRFEPAAHLSGNRGVAARAFLDHALQRGDGEGDARRLDALEVDRAQQFQRLDRAERGAGCAVEGAHLDQLRHGGRHARHVIGMATLDQYGAGPLRPHDATEEATGFPVRRHHRCRVERLAVHPAPCSTL